MSSGTRVSRLALLVLAAACAPAAPTVRSVPVPAEVPAAEPIAASTDTAALSRARALPLVERSLAALGGRERVLGLGAFELALEARALRGGWQQARRWTDSTPNPIPTQQRWLVDLARARATFEFLSTSPGSIQFNYRSGYDTTGQWQVDLMRWRLGDDLLRGDAAGGRANLAAAMRMLPQGIVRQALRARESLRDAGARTLDGRALTAVTFVEAWSGQRVEVAFDAATALPVLVTAGPASLELDDWRDVDGLAIPHLRRQRAGGAPVQEIRVTRVDLRPRLDDARFAPPQGYAPAPAPGTPRATRVADGVYRLDDMPGGYHAAFVVGQGGVVVLEAPTSPAFSDVALGLIERTAPGAPVTHVLVTHHHNDHVGGLGPYVARGAVLVVGAGLEEAIRRQLPDSLRARARFEPVSAARDVGAGAGLVRAIPVPNTHADGNLAFWHAPSGTLFQGDLFYIPERGAVPPAFPVTEALAEVVRGAGLRVQRVIGVHGRSGTWAEVEESIRLRPRPTVPPSR